MLSFLSPKSAPKTPLDFVALGDTVVDEFIELEEARVHCGIDDAECTISMRWGDKIPFKSAVLVAGVGNSANAAVSASRLGLSAALITDIGRDRDGEEVISALKKEALDDRFIKLHDGKRTNHHYVLSYESERTILVKHEEYERVFPKNLPAPKALYLSSLGDVPDAYYDAIAEYAEAHPDMLFAFQPGTFQMKMGTDRLKRIYARADIVFCNKEESQRILKSESTEIKELLAGMRALGAKKAVITDGRNGAHASDGEHVWFVPMYPDEREPKERTGAGDAFSSTVAAALVSGATFDEALLWGPINSMSVVQEIGAQKGLLTKEAMLAFRKNAPQSYQATAL